MSVLMEGLGFSFRRRAPRGRLCDQIGSNRLAGSVGKGLGLTLGNAALFSRLAWESVSNAIAPP
jgi:hypothetical protein